MQDSIPGLWDHALSRRQMLKELSHTGVPHSLSLNGINEPKSNSEDWHRNTMRVSSSLTKLLVFD